MSECTHNCSTCSSNCSSRQAPQIKPLDDVNITKIIGVLSGKGGVGKSMTSALLAIELANQGYRVGIMDADITGPSIPKMFGANVRLAGDDKGIIPYESPMGIKAVSINMMLDTEDTPVIWRGPVLGSIIRQFYTEVHWGDLDYLVIDMPPGTGDVALSVVQDIPIDGFLMVTSPSKLVSMVVSKAIRFSETAKTPVIGLVENMSYVKCDECGHEIVIYKNDDTQNVADKFGLDILAKLPLDPMLANLADEGFIEDYEGSYLLKAVRKIEQLDD